MIRALYFSREGGLQSDLPPQDFARALNDAQGVLWVDLDQAPVEMCLPVLRDTFRFHPLAIDDALVESHSPKIDDWIQYLYLALQAVVIGAEAWQDIETHELDVFVGPNYLVTYHTQPVEALERVWQACRRDERHMQKGACGLLYRVADELASDCMVTVETIDDELDLIEDQIFGDPGPHLLEQIFTLKRTLVTLRRIIAPQREVLNRMARGGYATIPPEQSIFFRDVYDHLVRLYDIIDSLRDLVSGALDSYLSVTSNRMNEVMKTLTVITTLFMPISFLAGFFGMNFFQPNYPFPAWTSSPAFIAVLLSMAFAPVGMFLWMRRRAWM